MNQPRGYFKNLTKAQVINYINKLGFVKQDQITRYSLALSKRMREVLTLCEIVSLLPKSHFQNNRGYTFVEIEVEMRWYSENGYGISRFMGSRGGIVKGRKAYHHWFKKLPKKTQAELKEKYFPLIWTLDTVIVDAKNYKTLIEWKKSGSGAYYAYRNRFSKQGAKIKSQVTGHMKMGLVFKGKIKRTPEDAKLVCSRYTCITRFRAEQKPLVCWLCEKKIYKKYTKHMTKSKTTLEISKYQPRIVKNLKRIFPHLEIVICSKKEMVAREILIDYFNHRPDILVYNPYSKRFIFIEIKTDTNSEGLGKLLAQVSRYQLEGIKNKLFMGVIVASPNGFKKGCSAFRQVPQLIKAKKI